jgi:hypothetical protein
MLIAVKPHGISSRAALSIGAAFLTIPAPVLASDFTPMGGVILLAGSAIALIAAALAALHRFLAIGLLVVCTIPLARGIMLAFVYIKSAVWLAAVGFLVTAALYCFATVWRLNRDYWSKQ